MQIEAPCFSTLAPNPFVNEVRVEAMVKGDAGNRGAGVGAVLNDLGFERLGIGATCWLHEIPA